MIKHRVLKSFDIIWKFYIDFDLRAGISPQQYTTNIRRRNATLCSRFPVI